MQGRVSQGLRAKFGYFLEKYKLEPYTKINEPLVQYGCGYGRGNDDLDVLRAAKGPVIMVWAGTDLLNHAGKPLFKSPKFRHVACSSMAEKDLRRQRLRFKRVNILPVDVSDIKVAPLGTHIYTYANKNRWKFYGGEIIDRLKMNYPLIVADSPSRFDRPTLLEAYRDSYIGLRLTEHDSLSVTVCELGLMGRMCVYNEDTPNAIPWKNIEDIRPWLNRDIAPREEVVAEQMRAFLDCGKEWLDLDSWDHPGS